ncbi:MAG: 30S ribosomal protein S20 [Candidatus Omnitrophica bacterium]|nr:30S ribosomal protein S20 [Candidatus Omnitrophota bacterium]
MPTRKSAIRDLKKNKIRHTRNKAVRSELKTRDKAMNALLGEKKLDKAKGYLKTYITKLDKAASKKIIHKNKASRKSSRLMKKLNSLTSASTT